MSPARGVIPFPGLKSGYPHLNRHGRKRERCHPHSVRQLLAEHSEGIHRRRRTSISPFSLQSFISFTPVQGADPLVPKQATHRWTLFLRGPSGEDLSILISKVAFALHPSFPQPIRGEDEPDFTCIIPSIIPPTTHHYRRSLPRKNTLHMTEVTAPPFEVTEFGWGEFECAIRIFWQDPAEQPIDLFHLLKLYHTDGPTSKKPVMSEKYDEVVFTDPEPHFLRLLRSYGAQAAPSEGGMIGSSSFSDFYTDFSDTADIQRLTEVQSYLKGQIEGTICIINKPFT